MLDSFLFANGLKNEELLKFKQELKSAHLKKGEHFISSGQISRYLALIETGYLRTYHLDDQGNEITSEFNIPSSFCSSYYSFYSQQPSFEFIEAITDCELLLLSYSSLQRLYSESFQINVFGRTILEKACIERDLRLKKILHLPAKQKYQWFLDNYIEVYKVAKLGSIASFLGMKQETLSRVRRKF
jgi:CRP/FNR family transcriptional regulator, anaerobic regulatory protein